MHSKSREHDFAEEEKWRIFYQTGSMHGFAVFLSPSGGKHFQILLRTLLQQFLKWMQMASNTFHVSVHLGIYHSYGRQRRRKRRCHACTEHSNPLPHLHLTNTIQSISSHTLYICYKRLIKLRPSYQVQSHLVERKIKSNLLITQIRHTSRRVQQVKQCQLNILEGKSECFPLKNPLLHCLFVRFSERMSQKFNNNYFN